MCGLGLGSKPRLGPGFRRLGLSKCWGRAKAVSDGRLGLGLGLSHGLQGINTQLIEYIMHTKQHILQLELSIK
jgi:hypothetical protein